MDQPTETKAAETRTAEELLAAELEALLVHSGPHLRWYHLEQPDSELLEKAAQLFGFHELEIEDCRHLRHQAKFEEYENHIFIIANTIHFVPHTLGVWFGELDVFLGPDFLVTVHVGPTRSVREVLPRIKASPKLQRPDRVLHALLDNMVDRYLPVLDTLGERIDEIEDQVHKAATPKTLADLFALKRGLIEFRRTVGSMREMVNALMRLRAPYYRADMSAYWRDLYDHILRALSTIETYRDLLTGVLDVYLTATANRTNEIMKVLTIYATIGLPLYLLTGYFGMNFIHLPLIDHPYGVAIMHSLMVVLTAGMLLYFRRKKWL